MEEAISSSRTPVPWPAVAGLNVLAIGCYVAVGWRSGDLTHISSTVFSSVDAGTYRQVADWIFGSGPKTAAVAQRPFLYPLVLGALVRIGGAGAVWLLNFVLWVVAINVTGLTVYRFVRRWWAAALASVVMASNISIIILTFHALAETLAVALLAIWAYGLVNLSMRVTPAQAAWVVLPLTLLAVAKPEFELLLGFAVLVILVLAVRSPGRTTVVATVLACLVPVAAQVALMETVNHYVGLSEVGDGTIRAYYGARLYAVIAHSSDIEAQRPLTAGLATTALLQVMAVHPFQAVQVLLSTLKENLLSGSNFVGGSNPTLGRAIVLTNYLYAVALVALVPLVSIAIWTRRDGRLILLCAGILNILLTGSLSFWQGDRLTVIALPLWLVALALALDQAVPKLPRLSLQRRELRRRAA